MKGIRTSKWLLGILYILAFILLREWLLPVMELSDTNHLSLFLLFILLSFVFSLTKVSWWISAPIKILYVFGAIHYIYLEKVLLSKDSVQVLITNISTNIPILINGNWESITDPFRTVLFFVLLWMTTYLIRYWIEVRKNIFLFYALTVLYIAFIDTFSMYSADGVIFRIMITGLLLLGLLYISKLAERHNTAISAGTFAVIAVPLLFVVVGSGVFANLLPISGPVWADPVPFLKAAVDSSGESRSGSGSGIAKSGYGLDDSVLGGDFTKDNSLVFEAEVERKQYWKIETKNTYTSKGWEQRSTNETQDVFSPGMEMTQSNQSNEDEVSVAELEMSEKYPFLIYPYGMTMVSASDDVLFVRLNATGQYRTKIGESESSLDSYGMQFVEHDFSLKELRDTRMDSIVPSEFPEFLQLPEELPERVKSLAETITEENDSVYDKAKSIERYFSKNGFVYNQSDIATPTKDEDYVDQFLFDTKRGYCDNFSTSMVVMLRSIGIPARWVKGFAPGETGRNADGDRVYQITNNEAHSWVEAYMPGIGWMPFEPTIGFGGPATIDYDIELDLSDPEIPEKKEQEKPEKQEKEKTKDSKEDFSVVDMFGGVGKWFKSNALVLLIVAAVVLFISWKLYAARRKWLPKLLVPAYRSGKQDWDNYSKRYMSLLKQLDRFGMKRKNNETLTTYADKVDAYFGGNLMKQLTNAYEEGLYGDDTMDHDWLHLKEMWEDLINRTSG